MGKFGNNEWKLMRTSSVKQVGDTMDGELRSCVPPESIFETFEPITLNKQPKRISFMHDDFIPQKRITVSCDEKVDRLTLAFVPSRCRACTSWDTWGFGLVMGELLLNSSAIHLPNFDRNASMHLKTLYEFKPEAVEVNLLVTPFLVAFLYFSFI